jgi:hypothetical protein
VRIALAGTAAILLLIAGFGCGGHRPSTRVMVYNQSLSAFTVEGHEIEVHSSHSVYTANGIVDTLDMTRSTVFARLVISSLVPAEDPNDYDAAVNVHQDSSGALYILEFSPYIDAEIIAP